jgi:hypothetical protein
MLLPSTVWAVDFLRNVPMYLSVYIYIYIFVHIATYHYTLIEIPDFEEFLPANSEVLGSIHDIFKFYG